MSNSVQLNTKKLKALRGKQGLSQEHLADKSIDKGFTLSLSTIKRAELGKFVSYRTAVNFSRFYEVALKELINKNNDLDALLDEKNNQTNKKIMGSVLPNDSQNTVKKTNPHFVGRTHELMQVNLSLRSCIETSEGCIFYIRGVAGIGKTAFMQQCKRLAEEAGYQQIHIENNVLADISWMNSFQTLIEGLLGINNSSPSSRYKQNIHDLAEAYQLSEGEQLQLYLIFELPLTAALQQLNNTLSYAESLDLQNSLIIQLIRHISQPLLLSVEDLHYAPEKLLHLLKYLSRYITHQPIIFLLSARLEEDPLDFLWRSHISSTPFITLDLTQVSVTDALKISENYQCHDRYYQQQCLKLAKGNPLFLHQLLLNYPSTVGELPSSILQLCQEKLKRLKTLDYNAICVSSLVGERIDSSIICYVLNIGSFDHTALVKQHLLVPDQHGFRFYHGLIRHSITQLVDKKQKLAWHIKISQWYKDIDNTLYAKHLLKARHHSTISTFIHVAEKLMGKHNYADALDIVDKALDTPLSSSQSFSLLLLKGELLYLLGLPEKSIAYLQYSLPHAEGDEISAVQIKLTTVFIALNRIDEAKKHLREAEKNLIQYPNKQHSIQLRMCTKQLAGDQKMFDHHATLIEPSLNHDHFNTLLPNLEISQDDASMMEGVSHIKVGILHSQTGFLKELESGVIQCTLMAINEINNSGGLLGRKIQPVLVDAKSHDKGFYQGAKTLINNADIVTLFGCSTSSSRKVVKPLIEQANHLLVYPFQYEGIEQSSHIAYVGPVPNQQTLPAIEWLISKGKQRFLLIGSDYIYPKVTNKIIKQELESWNIDLTSESYIPLADTSFDHLTAQINHQQPDVIISTVVGFESNKALLQAIHNSQCASSEMTTLSLVLSEDDLLALPTEHTQDVHSAFSYFQNIHDTINDDFVRRFKQIFGVDRRIGGYMEAAYTGVNLWAKGVQKAGCFKPADILQGMRGISYYAPGGMVYFDEENNHVWRHARLAVVDANKEYQVLWDSPSLIKPTPYPQQTKHSQWADYLQKIQTEYNGQWSKQDDTE